MSIHDGFVHQLPDLDPDGTEDWLESLDSVVEAHGRARARFVLQRLHERARELGIEVPPTVTTPYVNTISAVDEPAFPGDDHIERRIRSFIRWNAAVMVIRANKAADGIGGHLSTFASSAAQYEVGFNHFFRGKDGGRRGDHLYIQGHAAPGIYARSYLEGRLSEDQLDHFRREVGGRGLSSYPHPRLMPDYWEFPTVSMGLGALNSIYHARFLRYLDNRGLDESEDSLVWAFVGDGETDEPETLGSISLAAREGLDNLIWVVNCNLQRLDGPVRGNGKIIQELEANFRGSGWNVIKVIWGGRWDELLDRDADGALIDRMAATVDGEYQRYAVEDGAYIREHFFGPEPALQAMVEHLSDDELRNLPRGGHDYEKLYSAYKTATELRNGAPTVILAKTIKGWTLGEGFEGRNATHQIKKMTRAQVRDLRSRLRLEDDIADEALDADAPPYFRPAEGSDEHAYLLERRAELGGFLPSRVVHDRRPLPRPGPSPFAGFDAGSGDQAVSTTGAFTRLLRDLCREEGFGERVVPIVPDEARTFGMDGLFREFEIYAAHGQKYEPVDHDLLLSYAESSDGQLLEEGITEAGALASWTAAATSYATRGVPMVPFYTFYSMFGFQRVGDAIWAASDARARGFLLGATAGRTTLPGEGLQHQDGHSHLLASTVPHCRAYDPAFAYETAAIIEDGLRRMYPSGDVAAGEDVFYYLTLYNETYPMPALPEEATDGILEGMYRFAPAPDGDGPTATILFSGSAHLAARQARSELAEHYGVRAELWSVTSYKALREQAVSTERWNRLHPGEQARTPRVTERLASDTGPVVAVTDFLRMVPDQVSRWVHRPWVCLGTDGFGRSDTRETLRRLFEVDAAHVVQATLDALAAAGTVDASLVEDAIDRYDIDPDRPDPWEL